MPRELKKRGRREEEKNKRKAQESAEFDSSKRQRRDQENALPDVAALDVHGDAGDDFIHFGADSHEAHVQDRPQDQYYGLLDEDEQSYYASVNAKIVANDFESDEDRALFIAAVHRETSGKELKVASSQSCSRYLEKVILLSTPDQLKSLFTAFLENLTYLVQHRFGSHCCEALLLQAAKYVSPEKKSENESDSIESLFLQATEQLKPNLGFLVTDRFATHVVRVQLLILGGEDLSENVPKVVASRKKEKIDLPLSGIEKQQSKRKVPKSFKAAQHDLISAAFSSLDTTYVRALATHPTGNPFLQLVLRIELTASKSQDQTQQTLFQKLFPDTEFEDESETAKFLQGLIYDPTGSHLVEVLIQTLPGKAFKKLYSNFLKSRLQNFAKNDIASYIAIRILERLGKDDLAEACNLILPAVPGLIARNRLDLIKTLFDRFAVRDGNAAPLVKTVTNGYGDDERILLFKMLRLNAEQHEADVTISKASESKSRGDVHGSLLAQAMLKTSTGRAVIEKSLLIQPHLTLLLMAKDSSASRLIQTALSSDSSPKFRRQFVPKFFDHVAELAPDVAGSHVVDALWDATNGAHFMKERIAAELVKSETGLRESTYGRTVWRNWSMDVYQRRRAEWNAVARGDHAEHEMAQHEDSAPKKSAIQLARERHAKAKARGGVRERASPAHVAAEA